MNTSNPELLTDITDFIMRYRVWKKNNSRIEEVEIAVCQRLAKGLIVHMVDTGDGWEERLMHMGAKDLYMLAMGNQHLAVDYAYL